MKTMPRPTPTFAAKRLAGAMIRLADGSAAQRGTVAKAHVVFAPSGS